MFNDYFFSCSIWKIKKKFSFHCASLSHFFIPPPTAFYYIFNVASYKMAPLICFPCWSLQQVLSPEMPCSEKDKVPETEAKADCLLGHKGLICEDYCLLGRHTVSRADGSPCPDCRSTLLHVKVSSVSLRIRPSTSCPSYACPVSLPHIQLHLCLSV